jgi:choice-of-anchor A domain-containing protein/prepilin-type N-terminal cleavage/methylation domain-containing protein
MGDLDRDDPNHPNRAIRRTRHRCARDRGFSLVEVLVSIVLLGTAGVAVLGAMAASAKGSSTHRGVADAQTAIAAASEALMGIKPVPCASAAATYASIVKARVAALQLTGWSGSNVSVTAVNEWKNGAPLGSCTSTSAPINPQLVTLQVVSPDGRTTRTIQVMTASNPTTTIPIGNPFAYNDSIFNVIAEGDAVVQTQIYAAIAVGGDLRWSNSGPIAANDAGGFVFNGAPVSLVVQGRARFDQSSGTLQVNHGSAVIGDTSNGQLLLPGGANCWAPLLTIVCDSAPTRISLQAGGTVMAGFPIDFVAAFDGFRKTAAGFAALPGTCVDATSAVLRDQNNTGPYGGTGNFVLDLAPDKINVLNLSVSQLNGMASGSANGGSDSATHTSPLLINVTDAGAISLAAPTFTQNYPSYVIWNFPNATSVNITGEMWGSLYAPNASVRLNHTVRGIVIAKDVASYPAVVDWNQRPDITTQCTRSG